MSDASTTAWVKAMPAVFVLIWSTGFIVARYGMPFAPPFTFLLWRYFFSIVCFLPWIVLARVAWPKDRRQMLHLAVTGMLMHAGYLGGVWAAVKAGMGSGLSSLIVGIQPVLTAIWLSTLSRSGGAAVSRRQWLGLLLGFAGLVMVVSRKFAQGTPLDHVTFENMAWAVMAVPSKVMAVICSSNSSQAISAVVGGTRYIRLATVAAAPRWISRYSSEEPPKVSPSTDQAMAPMS